MVPSNPSIEEVKTLEFSLNLSYADNYVEHIFILPKDAHSVEILLNYTIYPKNGEIGAAALLAIAVTVTVPLAAIVCKYYFYLN